ncbi:glutaredoxin family protein [Cytobacillus sp. Hz8]|uniref:glutaredoxin family protein n=1 Tax=Cytobacillus sp. Hz8 TaxID=3347168 RepID=UPI0035D9EDD3
MNSITVYTTTRCPYCTMLKNFLLDQNIPFKEINVEQNPHLMEKLVRMTGQMGVPQSEVNGKWIVGYDPNSIMREIKG